MNILLVNSAAPDLWGGGEKWFVQAARWFNRNGHRAVLVARLDSKLLARANEFELATISCRFGGDYDLLAMLRARQILAKSHANVVLTNFNKESWQFGVAGRSMGVAVVARHGFTLWSKKLRHKILAQKVISRLIVNAASIRESYLALGLAPNEIDVIHNGIETVPQKSGELRRQLGISDNALLLVAAGRLEAQKRFDRLLNFAAELKKTAKFTLAIFGTGPHEVRLLAQVAELGLQDTVVFRGFDSDFASLVGDANLFLLTSSEEGTPNVVLEAMSAGVPVLGFDVGAMKEILVGDLAEFLIPRDEELLFLARLRELTEDIPRLNSCRSKFRARAVDEFSFDRAMDQYLHILSGVATRA